MVNRDEDYQEWEQRLGRIAAVAASWQGRMAEPPPPVEPGSALAGDDQLAELGLSSLAWYNIAAGVEHLDFTTAVMIKTGVLYPTAYLTVLRTALLTATHAVRILGPAKRRDRQAHALRLMLEDVSSQLASVNELELGEAHLRDLQVIEINRLTQRLRDLEPLARRLGIVDKDIRRVKANATEEIAWVARFMHDQDILVTGTQLLWRTGSAVAHGARSHAIRRLDRFELLDAPDGSKYAKLHGDIQDVGSAASAVTLVLSRAFELFDVRRTNHRTI